MEALQHQAHLAELQWQWEQQREMEHQANLAGVQQQQEHQRQMELPQNQANLAALQQLQQEQREIDHNQDVNQHQIDVDQQQQILQQEEVEHIQRVMNDNQALRNIPKGCHPYHEPLHRHSLGPMDLNVQTVMLCI